jgi:hypothetical protein
VTLYELTRVNNHKLDDTMILFTAVNFKNLVTASFEQDEPSEIPPILPQQAKLPQTACYKQVGTPVSLLLHYNSSIDLCNAIPSRIEPFRETRAPTYTTERAVDLATDLGRFYDSEYPGKKNQKVNSVRMQK